MNVEEPTLDNLHSMMIIPANDDPRRLIGGETGSRWASDGAAMFLIPEDEYQLGLQSQLWFKVAIARAWEGKQLPGSLRPLARPEQLRPATVGASALYAGCWLAVQYVDIAMRLGGDQVCISGLLTAATVPGIAVIMPVNHGDDEDDEELIGPGEAGR